jgi:hypothetical protein
MGTLLHFQADPDVAGQQQHQVLNKENLATQKPSSQSFGLFCVGVCDPDGLLTAT